VVVKATDGGGLSASAQVRIDLNDVNERPNIDDAARSVGETTVFPGDVGLPLEATDPDANQELTFTIVGGTGKDKFLINRCSGQIGVAPGQSLDFETAPFWQLRVRVEDNGSPML